MGRYTATAAFLLAIIYGCSMADGAEQSPSLIETPVSQTESDNKGNGLIGMNLDIHTSYASHILFIDQFKRSREWIASRIGSDEWNMSTPVPLNEDGYPSHSPFRANNADHFAITVMLDGLNGNYPPGVYTFSFEGNGTIVIDGDTEERVFFKAGVYKLQVNPGNKGIYLSLIFSDVNDPVRNIKFLLPGHESVNPDNPYYQTFIDRLKPFSVVRAMQIMRMNDGEYPCDNGVAITDPGCIQGWGSRAKVNYATQTSKRGLAYEHLIQIANRANSHLWVNIIHAADDNFVRQFAIMLRDSLTTSLKVYVELSNEAWNWTEPFPQSQYFINKGVTQNMFAPDRDGDATDAGRVAFVRRTARVFEIFEEVFTGDHRARLVKVVPVWMGDWRHSERIMQLYHDPVNNPNAVAANAMAVAPYFGWIVPVAVIHNNEQHSVSVEEILRRAALNIDTDQPDPLGYDGIDEGIETMIKQHKPIADKYGMEMIAYEGGSHLALIEGADEPLATKLVEANRSPQMYELYERLLGVWFENGGGLFVAFSYTQSYNKWGSFGHLEWMDQPIEQSHKLRALLDRINK